MVQRQRENVAKYLYDLSKILFAATVVGNLAARERFDVVTFLRGTCAALGLLWLGYSLDGVRE